MKYQAVFVLAFVAAVSFMEIKRRTTMINNHQINFAGGQPASMPPPSKYMNYYPNGYPFMPPQQPNEP